MQCLCIPTGLSWNQCGKPTINVCQGLLLSLDLILQSFPKH